MNKALKIIGIVLAGIGVLALLVIGIFSLAWNLTAGIADSADKFFTMVKDNKVQEAYSSTAKAFQAATTYDEFTAFLKSSDMDKYVSASWSTREVVNNEGHLEGSITTSDKGIIPVELNLVKEGDNWKILNLRPVVGGLQPKTSSIDQTKNVDSPALPSDEEVAKMTNDSMLAFADAVKSEDFSKLYNDGIADLWKSQTTAEELKGNFQAFIDQKVDFSFLADSKPEFSGKPALNEQNFLVVQGTYPSKDMNADFTLKFANEGGKWKLVGIDIYVK